MPEGIAPAPLARRVPFMRPSADDFFAAMGLAAAFFAVAFVAATFFAGALLATTFFAAVLFVGGFA